MEKNVKVSILCQIYGKLLTEKQLTILDNYYKSFKEQSQDATFIQKKKEIYIYI